MGVERDNMREKKKNMIAYKEQHKEEVEALYNKIIKHKSLKDFGYEMQLARRVLYHKKRNKENI